MFDYSLRYLAAMTCSLYLFAFPLSQSLAEETRVKINVNVRNACGAPMDGRVHFVGDAYSLSEAKLKFPHEVTNEKVLKSMTIDFACIQETLNALSRAAGGYIYLTPGDIPVLGGGQLAIDASKTGIRGSANGNLMYTQAQPGVPAVYIFGGNEEYQTQPLIDVILDARTGEGGGQEQSAFPQGDDAVTAVSHTNYVPNSVAIYEENTHNSSFVRVGVRGFDQPFQLGPNTWSITWENCALVGNNYGGGYVSTNTTAVIKSEYSSSRVPSNSAERMTWIGGTYSNNNWGFYFDNSNVASTNFLINVSIDYNNIGHLKTIDYMEGRHVSSVLVVESHLETSNKQSGTNLARVQNDGSALVFQNDVWSEQGHLNPKGLVTFLDRGGNRGSIRIDDCIEFTAVSLPFDYQPDEAYHDFNARNNATRFPNAPVIAYSSPNGDRLEQDNNNPVYVSGNEVHHLSIRYQNKTILVNSLDSDKHVTFVVDPDSVTNHEVGTMIKIVNVGRGSVELKYALDGGRFILPRGWKDTNGTHVSSSDQPGFTWTLIKIGKNAWLLSSLSGE